MIGSSTIWKYKLAIDDEQLVSIPRGSQILSVAEQYGSLCMWVHVSDPAAEQEEAVIEICGTGNPIPERHEKRKFIGTVLMTPFVWHVFERIRAGEAA